MVLVIDGEIYQRQSHGGISRIFNEILPRMCDLDGDLRFKILIDGQVQQTLPGHAQISHCVMPRYHLYLRPGRLWRPVVSELKLATRRWYTGDPSATIWQATYYSPPKRWSGPFVVLVYDLMEERFPELFDQPRHDVLRHKKREAVQAADVVICISHTTQQDVCAVYGLPESKTRVITLAPSGAFWAMTDAELAVSGMAHIRPYLLYIGDRSAYKNFHLLLEAYSTWPARRAVDLLVVGPKWTSIEQEKLQELGVNDAVFLHETVDDHTLRLFYNQAVALVYPSLYEGFGIPLLEAMACGCPVVASVIPSTLEIAGDFPWYFFPTDRDDLKVALERALSEGRQQAQVAAAQDHAAQYSWDTTSRQMLGIYRELI